MMGLTHILHTPYHKWMTMTRDKNIASACMEQSNKFKLDSDLHTMIVVGIMWEKSVALKLPEIFKSFLALIKILIECFLQ